MTKQRLRNLGRLFGLEVRLTGTNSRDDLRHVEFLKKRGIDTVLDVGANNGGFAKGLLSNGFKGRIISFEPLPQAHKELLAAARRASGHWIIAPRVALDNKMGVAKFFETDANTSSSLLEPTAAFSANTPQAQLKNTIVVPTQRLDEIVRDFSIIPKNTILKLDVQGGEERVLQGATELLGELGGVLSEMSVTSLYKSQADFAKLHSILTGMKFELWDIWPGYRDPVTNRLLQFDGLYFRE